MNKTTLKNAALSAGVILGILLLIGGTYAWFSERIEPSIDNTVSAPKTDPNPIKATKPDPNANESAAIEALTSPVKPGQNAVTTVRTLPRSICTIVVTYNEVESKDSGLITKHANDFGIVGWSWTVDASAPAGDWPIEVTCALHDKSAFVRGKQTVQR
jgi:hypothetical protein